MAKISPVSIKYIIHAKLDANGAVEKPDIIGAIFGQTEGLLGEELEMRELQKSGKIGRIEVTTDYENGKTIGEIEVPSAMDKTETTIIAAALETIERVGPSDTKITIEGIEDVRGSKRDYILERAKKLMEKLGDTGNDFSEITDEIKTSAKVAKMQTYGTENLPCGDISGDEIIIVEGRADVINLLKKGIKNVIAMNGTNLPPTIRKLTEEKPEVILFVDGDRGVRRYDEFEERKREIETSDKSGKEIQKMTAKEREQIKDSINELIGTKGVIIFNKKLEPIKKIPISRLSPLLQIDEEPYIIAIDGTATPKIVEICEQLGCNNLIATNFVYTETPINLVSM